MHTEELQARAAVMKALASPARLKIIEILNEGERCICEFQPLFHMNKSTLSRHVAALKNVGIVRERREGARTYLRLATPCILKIFDCTMELIQTENTRRSDLIIGT
ncbi:MAG: ArsR/SmtB family transcription factor [Kiritimatiellia bacterium]|nr:metalloregulator ArsR/SmtB family transcription factor [Lentisphaerota bacterium]